METRPILLNGDEVRAVLDNRKTQIRRVVKPQPTFSEGVFRAGLDNSDPPGWWTWEGDPELPEAAMPSERLGKCPFGVPGDRLWVRETWFAYTGHGCIQRTCSVTQGSCHIGYRADMKDDFDASWRQSNHMPRWASRITQEVTDVRVERVQDITIDDMEREGIRDGENGFDSGDMQFWERFRELWDSTNAKSGHGWDANDWVWAVSFKRVEL